MKTTRNQTMTTQKPSLKQQFKQQWQQPLMRYIALPFVGGAFTGLLLTIAMIGFLIVMEPSHTAQWLSYFPSDLQVFCPAFGVMGVALGAVFFVLPHIATPEVAKGIGTVTRVFVILCCIVLFPIGIGMLVAGRKF